MQLIIIIAISAISILLQYMLVVNRNILIERNLIILPYWIKYIGIGILIICSILPSIFLVDDVDFLSNLRDFIVIIGLFLIVLSKEKSENQKLNNVRLSSLLISFFAGSIAYHFFLLFNLTEAKLFDMSYLFVYVSVLYLILFHSFKKTN